MGTLSSICAISGLPLQEGDSCRYFLLTENPFGHEKLTSAIQNRWIPRTWPLEGMHLEDGSVSVGAQGAETDLWVQAFRADISFNLLNMTPANLTFEKVQDAAAGGQLFVQVANHSSTPLAIRHAIIREEVWQALLQLPLAEGPDLAQMQVLVEKFAAYCRETLALDIAQSPDYLEISRRPATDLAWRSFGTGCELDEVSRELSRPSSDGTIDLSTHAKMLLAHSWCPTDFPARVAEFLHVQAVLRAVNYQWRPSYVSNDEGENWSAHQRFHNTLSRLAGQMSN